MATQLHDSSRPRKLHLLVASTGSRDTSWAQALITRFSKNSNVTTCAVVDDVPSRLVQITPLIPNRYLSPMSRENVHIAPFEPDANVLPNHQTLFYRQQTCELVEWADILVLTPLDADGIGKMIAGICDSFILQLLRSWSSTKNILLVPGMNKQAWAHPLTKRQLKILEQDWPWVRVMPPILWHYEANQASDRPPVSWPAFDQVVHLIQSQADLIGLSQDVATASSYGLTKPPTMKSTSVKLPPEIWTLILEHTNDWELATALGFRTSLPRPACWTPRLPSHKQSSAEAYMHNLEWTILTRGEHEICKMLEAMPKNAREVSSVCVNLLIRFALVRVLEWIDQNKPNAISLFHRTALPVIASAYYGRIDVLEYWKNSPFFDPDMYAMRIIDAIDGASRNGHVEVLDWWRRKSSLPFLYTEAALEQASSNGHLLVLEWWRDATAQDDRITPLPGRSLPWAAQNGRVDVLRWWHMSGIPTMYSDDVVRIASRWGHVKVLELWRQLQGDDKLVFDAKILEMPTFHKHIAVLEWWRQYAHGELPGMDGRKHRVEYRTCNIEEALEDSIGDQSGVREWWTRNGLNLGLRNMEWMTTKCL